MLDPNLKQGILNRLKSVEGHVRGIQRMVEDDQYCIDILNQTSAIHKALQRVDAMILENHLESCVTTAIRGDDAGERERVIRELLMLFSNYQPQALNSQQPTAVGHQHGAATVSLPLDGAAGRGCQDDCR